MKKPEVKIRLIRPLLTMMIILTARVLVHASLVSADNYAIIIANQILDQANKNGKYPSEIVGWKKNEYGASHMLYGKYGTKYPMQYCISDAEKFSISVYHNIDEGFTVIGGVGEKLRANRWCENESREVPLTKQ